MIIAFESYKHDEEIPIKQHIKERKFIKYFSRETAAALVCLNKLLLNNKIDTETPVYYATGIVEYEDFGLDKIYEACSDNGEFSQKFFIEKGMSSVSPLTQFKVLYNMTLCFISIEHNLHGDNAAIYSSASGLLNQALYSPFDSLMLLGAGKIYKNGNVEAGFALVSKDEIINSPHLHSPDEAIEIFRHWSDGIK